MLDYFINDNVIGSAFTGDIYYVDDINGIRRIASQTEILDAVKKYAITRLKQACKSAIEAGFYSSALGSQHKYDSALPQDQTNLVGARLAGVDMMFTCTDEDGIKTERYHTAAQIQQVFFAGMVHIQTQKAKFYEKVAAVNTATTQVEVDGVLW